MVTRKGIIKRTRLDAYKNIRKSGLIAIGLNDDDELAWVRLTNRVCELLIATRETAWQSRFDENDVRLCGQNSTTGVRPSGSKTGMRWSAWRESGKELPL